MRKGQEKPFEVTITRARIQVRSVRSRLEGDDVGFIRITQFNEQTTRDLKKAITDLAAQSVSDPLAEHSISFAAPARAEKHLKDGALQQRHLRRVAAG